MSLLGRLLGRKEKAAGGWDLPVTGGHLPYETGRFWNWWQMGKDPIYNDRSPMVHACIDAYAQTIGSLRSNHYQVGDDGFSKKKLLTSSIAELIRNPNSYQTRSDFMLNMIKSLMYTGNSYAVAIRNDRGQITSMHLVPSKSTQPYVEPETQSVFYALGDNPMMGDISAMIPARDVLHIRLYTPSHPLVGVSPVENLATDIAANNAITAHQATFFQNMARPSGVLRQADGSKMLTAQQIEQLRDSWNEMSQGMNSGKVPILQGGLEWQNLSLSSQDAELINAFQMTNETIARGFRVPLPLVGDLRNATYNNVEQLIQSWLSSGLGFLLEHIELSFDKFFDLPATERIEFDVDTLLRTDFAGRIEGLVRGTQGALYTPNEARAKEGLPPVDNGDKPYMQQQMVELGYRPENPIAEPPAVDDETAKAIALSAIKKAMTDE